MLRVTHPLWPQGRFWVQGPSASPATHPDASIWCSGCALVFIAQGKGGLGGQDWVASNERVAGCGTVLPSAQLAERARPQAASAQTRRRWCDVRSPRCVGFAQGGGNRGDWRRACGAGLGLEQPWRGRAGPVRVRSGVCQGPSRQQTHREPARAFRRQSRGCGAGHGDFPWLRQLTPALSHFPALLCSALLLHDRRNPGESKWLSLGDSICSEP